eukprot:TRINITY_DN5113_c0_g1_i4.p1 TRINITY_DN5113_c0_g1~~TRINITY_DN5113_c0_g1_i4.p1  ORF type:complete len:211 (-),score=23.75 TRINITY_DN5113_c0_g1_i4:435-1067(-)
MNTNLVLLTTLIFSLCCDMNNGITLNEIQRLNGTNLNGVIGLHQRDQNLYASSYNKGAFTVYNIANNGLLQPTQIFSPGAPANYYPDTPFGITTSPDGSKLFLIAHGYSESGVLSFSRSPSGNLTYLTEFYNPFTNILSEAISLVSDQSYIYVASEGSSFVTILEYSPNGDLDLKNMVNFGGKSGEGVALFGDFIYVSGIVIPREPYLQL